MDTPVINYLDTFCQTLAVEKDDVSRSDEQNMDALTHLTDLDSGDICALDQHVWDKEVDQWLDDVMEVIEDNLDVGLLEDMSVEEWVQLMEDVTDPFDLDAFVS